MQNGIPHPYINIYTKYRIRVYLIKKQHKTLFAIYGRGEKKKRKHTMQIIKSKKKKKQRLENERGFQQIFHFHVMMNDMFVNVGVQSISLATRGVA